MEEIIVVNDITKEFPGVLALDDVSLGIQVGEIHTIVGENGAGKSTLMKILSGVYAPDCGEIIYKGESIALHNPLQAIEIGISTVYQELQLCENMRVVENVFMGKELRNSSGRLDWSAMNVATADLLGSFEMDIKPQDMVADLSVAKRQIVEIVRAINQEVEVLILDEPTSSLTIKETEILFKNVRRLKEEGKTILFISHRMEEIFEISDRISVLRDGAYLGTYQADKLTPKEIIALIAGKELSQELAQKPVTERHSSELALEVQGLCLEGFVEDASFSLYRNEVIGFYGLQGAGRTELLETVFGLRKRDSGKIIMNDQEVNISNPKTALKYGIVMVPEDRRRAGIFGRMGVRENIGIMHDRLISTGGFLQNRRMKKMAGDYIKQLSIKVSDQEQKVEKLSGGNQQKVILSRCLSTNPEILILDEPTRGIDVGAKSEIYRIVKKLKDEGKSIIMISSEIEEIISECERVYVMHNGHIAGEVAGEEICKENILELAFNG